MGSDNKLKDRTGEVSYTKYGTKATIVEYVNSKKVLVEFDDAYKYRYYTSYLNFKNGSLTNPYEPRGNVGIGFIGVGKYNSRDHKLAYAKWFGMINRCKPDENKRYSERSYYDCNVCDEWLNFQNFAEWFYENCYECDEPLCIDKDILVHGSRTYAPDTCLLVPERINLLFIKEKGHRGDLPIGVQHLSKRRNGYTSFMSTSKGSKYLGLFTDINEAFNTYKKAKEQYIKEVADEYKDRIPKKIYDAMYSYEVMITD